MYKFILIMYACIHTQKLPLIHPYILLLTDEDGDAPTFKVITDVPVSCPGQRQSLTGVVMDLRKTNYRPV